MPIRNCCAFVGQTLKSLSNQTLKDIEIICFDDASTDGTLEVLEFFEGKDRRFRVFQTTQWLGGAWCRNEGNKYATSDIICVTDAGDIYHQNKAEIVYKYFKKHPQTDLLYHSVNIVDLQGRPIQSQMAFPYDYKNFPRGISHPTVAYKKEIVLKHHYRTTSRHTDQYEALFIELFLAGYKFSFIDNILLTKVDLSHLNTFRDINEARKVKAGIYEEFGINANIS